MSHGEAKTKRWRPWQFSLRFLMLVMFGVATFSGGWVANDWNRKRAIIQPAAPSQPIVKVKLRVITPSDLPVRRYDTTLINDLPK
jgi:hypothetical protein